MHILDVTVYTHPHCIDKVNGSYYNVYTHVHGRLTMNPSINILQYDSCIL